MEATFKIARMADLNILVPFVRDFYEYDGHHFDEAVVRTALTALFHDNTLGQTWFILADGAVAGYMILAPSYSLNHPGWEAFVDEIFIQESHRRHGLGRQTFDFIEGWCRAKGIGVLHLEVEQENTKASAFYRAMGFEDHDQYLMSWWVKDYPAKIAMKPADHSDLDTLVGLMREQQKLAGEAENRAALAELLGNDSLGKVWLIGAGAMLAGYLVLTYSYSLEFHGRDAVIDQLYLREGYQQSEFESRVIRFAQAASYALGLNALHVIVERKNIKTQALYRAAGFEDENSSLLTKRIVTER